MIVAVFRHLHLVIFDSGPKYHVETQSQQGRGKKKKKELPQIPIIQSLSKRDFDGFR
jgi:hypothetical protein